MGRYRTCRTTKRVKAKAKRFNVKTVERCKKYTIKRHRRPNLGKKCVRFSRTKPKRCKAFK